MIKEISLKNNNNNNKKTLPSSPAPSSSEAVSIGIQSTVKTKNSVPTLNPHHWQSLHFKGRKSKTKNHHMKPNTLAYFVNKSICDTTLQDGSH